MLYHVCKNPHVAPHPLCEHFVHLQKGLLHNIFHYYLYYKDEFICYYIIIIIIFFIIIPYLFL